MPPKSKAAPKKEAGPAAPAAGAAQTGGGGGTTRLQIMLDKKIVTPAALQVPAVSSPKVSDKTLEKTYDPHGTVKRQGSEFGLAAKAKSIEGHVNLEEMVEKYLTETETQTLFAVPSLCVALDDTQLHGAISAKNKKYEELLLAKRNAADQFRGQHQQTLNPVMKTKEILALPPKTHSMGVDATEWDIHDTFATKAIPKHEQIEGKIVHDTELLVESALKKKGCLFPLEEASTSAEEGGDAPTGAAVWTLQEDADLLSLTHSAAIMEKSVVQNVFHGQQMTYRNYPTLEQLAKDDEKWRQQSTQVDSDAEQRLGDVGSGAEGEKKEEGKEGEAPPEGESKPADVPVPPVDSSHPHLADLFSFDAPELTKGLATTCAEWNSHQNDLLAVAYGDTSASIDALSARREKDGAAGLILFWSLKNPSYPERILKTSSGVSSLAFSQTHPSMIAAGLVDGTVAVYDSRRATSTPVLVSGSSVSTQNDRKHTDCVWEVKWVSQNQGGSKSATELENLMSVSGDGKIFQWTMRKGLEQKQLMNLKRLPNAHLGSNVFRPVEGGTPYQGGAFRKAAGMAVDVLDASNYLVATDDGFVHRCSVSHNEQYLESFSGHSGSVYRVRCNPFYPNIFLTCSVDWTVRLWSCKTSLNLQKFKRDVMMDHSETEAENDDIPQAVASSQSHQIHLQAPQVMNFQSTDLTQAVQDVVWSPDNSTSFAACMNDGRVELWDLSVKPHDPLVVHHPSSLKGKERTFVRFARNSPVLVCGDGQGTVAVMRAHNTQGPANLQHPEQVDRLLSMIAANESKK
ncbi:unnamed protein product [Amoebophrya sp. A120]|nr:unnamed protein product [Amoebophrya sp. A120]|eukprot:GSA120T00012096001.1